jgi:hypothetical protein
MKIQKEIRTNNYMSGKALKYIEWVYTGGTFYEIKEVHRSEKLLSDAPEDFYCCIT